MMISPELIQTIESLNPTDKIKLQELLASAIDADAKKARTQRVEQLTQEIFRDHKSLFERLAKGVDEE